MLDEDPAVSYIYMKKVDVNGGEMCARYRYEEEPVPEFKPEQYITKEEFNHKFEEMLDAINSLKQHRSTADE